MKISAKSKKIISTVLFSAFVIFCFVFISVNIFKFIYDDSSTQAYLNDKYVVGVYDEKVAVFAQGDSVPIEVFEVYISTLPVKDQIELKKGIVVEGKSSLRKLIEDYTS